MIDLAKRIDKKLAILNVLKEQTGPASSTEIVQMLADSGFEFSERTVRFYLAQLDSEGLTRPCGRKGRVITEAGLMELQTGQIMYRPGYLSARIDQMVYRMTFDLATRSGTVVVNASIVDPHQLASCLEKVCNVFEKGYGMGRLMALLGPGESVGQIRIPPERIGFCTVCSITINGVLLKHGIPMSCRFGGLLMLKDGRPFRFTDVIHYDGTTIDPLEVFIRSGMTDYHGAIRDGNGLIGASFREIPADSRQRLIHISQRLNEVGLGAIMEVGLPNQPLLEIPVPPGRAGVIVVGGLNPIAILEELQHRMTSRALAGLLEFDRLFDYREAAARLQAYL